MKAIVEDRYGSPGGVLELQEIDMPVVKDGQALVRVRATSANTYGWDLPLGLRFAGRVASGLRESSGSVPGLDLAGQVEMVGKSVRQFRPGDAVFGWCKGAFAQYVSVSEDALALKPANLTFEQSAVIPISGFTALQALRDKGRLQRGQHVLIVGASGGVGTFAVQIAKAFGAEVTGVCSTGNVELVRSIGADHVIDYTQDDYTQIRERFDLIVDMAGDRSLSDLRRALTTEGTLVMVGRAGLATSGQGYPRAFARWFRAVALSTVVRQRLQALISTRSQADLVVLKELVESGKVTPVISGQYTLSEVTEALGHFAEGHARGKVVITV